MAAGNESVRGWAKRRSRAALKRFGRPVYLLSAAEWERLRAEIGPPPDKP